MEGIEQIGSLQPGGIYLLRANSTLTQEQWARVAEVFNAVELNTGCKFVVIDQTFELVQPVAIEPAALKSVS